MAAPATTSATLAPPTDLSMSQSRESLSSAYSDDSSASEYDASPEPPRESLPSVPVAPSMPSPVTESTAGTTAPLRSVSGSTWTPSTEASSTFTDTMQELMDTFSSALADLGIDEAPPVEGLEHLSVAYAEPAAAARLPRSTSTLESLLPPPDERAPALAPALARGPAPLPLLRSASISTDASGVSSNETITPGIRSPVPPSQAPPSETPKSATRYNVYGVHVWWPNSFDVASNLNYDSVSPQQRAALFAKSANDLYWRPTFLADWIEEVRALKPSTPEALLHSVWQAQRREMELAIATPSAPLVRRAPPGPPGDMPLPSNIPFPLLAKAQSAAHNEFSEAIMAPRPASHAAPRGTPALGAHATLSALAPAAQAPAPHAFAPPAPARQAPWPNLLPSARRKPAASSPAAELGPPARRVQHVELGMPHPAPVSAAPLGLGIMQRVTSAAPTEMPTDPRTEAQWRASLARMCDALPELDETTAQKYLQRHHGDDVRAIVRVTTDADRLSRRAAPQRTAGARAPRRVLPGAPCIAALGRLVKVDGIKVRVYELVL